MKVERIGNEPKEKVLVPCSLMEATHNMEGVQIASLERDEDGWMAIDPDGNRLSYMNPDGSAYAWEPGDSPDLQEFQAAKYVEAEDKRLVQITLTDFEAGVLKTILGQFGFTNNEITHPILSVVGKAHSLFHALEDIGVKWELNMPVLRDTGSGCYTPCSTLAMK